MKEMVRREGEGCETKRGRRDRDARQLGRRTNLDVSTSCGKLERSNWSFSITFP